METVEESVRARNARARVAITAAFGRDSRGFVRERETGAVDLITDLLHVLEDRFVLATRVQVGGVLLDDVSGEEAVLGVLSEAVGQWLCVSRANASAPDTAMQDVEASCADQGEVTISGPGIMFGASDPRWSFPYGRGWGPPIVPPGIPPTS